MTDPDLTNTLEEIYGFCEAISSRMGTYHIDKDSLETNQDHADLLLMPLCQIGESVQRARPDLERQFPEVPWHRIAGLRNVIVHGYGKVDMSTVYATVTQDIPELRSFCEEKFKDGSS